VEKRVQEEDTTSQSGKESQTGYLESKYGKRGYFMSDKCHFAMEKPMLRVISVITDDREIMKDSYKAIIKHCNRSKYAWSEEKPNNME
jgi:hypothetical protein